VSATAAERRAIERWESGSVKVIIEWF